MASAKIETPEIALREHRAPQTFGQGRAATHIAGNEICLRPIAAGPPNLAAIAGNQLGILHAAILELATSESDVLHPRLGEIAGGQSDGYQIAIHPQAIHKGSALQRTGAQTAIEQAHAIGSPRFHVLTGEVSTLDDRITAARAGEIDRPAYEVDERCPGEIGIVQISATESAAVDDRRAEDGTAEPGLAEVARHQSGPGEIRTGEVPSDKTDAHQRAARQRALARKPIISLLFAELINHGGGSTV